MNPVTSCLLVVLCLAFSISPGTAFNSGRPLCRHPDDFTRDWAVKNSPKNYWKCTAFGTAELLDCPEGQTFNWLHSRCTITGAVIGDIDTKPLMECGPEEAIDLSGDAFFCTKVPCEGGTIIYDLEGHPKCFEEQKSNVLVCPGATKEQAAVGTESCVKPRCDLAGFQVSSFYPSPDPTQFYRCANINTPVTMSCPAGLCYDHQSHGCVWPAQWRNSCA